MTAIAYYTGYDDPFYEGEGYARWMQYPPPYWLNGHYYYAWPWLWMDGDPDPGWDASTWEGYLLERLSIDSDLTIDLEGGYDGDLGMGWLGVSVHNEGSLPLTGRLQCVLTESNLYYEAPNDLDWHHHVMRDMIPDALGTAISVAPGETEVVAHSILVDPSWDESECELICFVHDDVFQPDSTREVWQGAKISLSELAEHAAGFAGRGAGDAVALHACHPNPARRGTRIAFDLPRTQDVRLTLFDVGGRRLRLLHSGVLVPGRYEMCWDGRDRHGQRVPPGVYFYRLEAGEDGRSHKLVVSE
ncbi:MAG: Omp28-related outer membrane protein [Candidatus Eisenbacteria bacterium]|nr:Omp28-related outer membrane protein [Candidatus Eisenbacteria bacterium]